MGNTRRTVVEDCEILKSTDYLKCLKRGLDFGTVPTRGRGLRLCLLCPRCGSRAFKLYKPPHLSTFACRACHQLTYTSVQKDDARLYRLLKVPEPELVRLVTQNENIVWKLLAIQAGYIRLGLISKY
jgi:hypothetical protein